MVQTARSSGLFLSTESNGKVVCASDITPAALFEVRAFPDGRWALISKLGSTREVAHQYYFGGAGENLDAFSKLPVVADTKVSF